ncbi:MAG: hypothetical protein ABTS16_00755 [Candidatus Accumulibacter phosphatis]|jgi:hypothetical protein|uniref:Uncharacterized protein n=1 Tax=Candidatus Accumulibacter contiguus TaxID=2954381 RepID=A0ABX1T851_9PROT|nr:hypothetical protein [Candidatus Accumulibacter contiguus]NMQ04593.1 hypothetical protein [Candidatus Accumulibacter contiguus]
MICPVYVAPKFELFSDRGSQYWHTPEAGGKVDKHYLTQIRQAMKRLGIGKLADYDQAGNVMPLNLKAAA